MLSSAKNNRVHSTPGKKSEKTGQDEPHEKQCPHDRPVEGDIPPACGEYSPWEHQKCENRQQMNWAENPNHAQLVNPKAGQGDHGHQRHPRPAQHPMRPRALGPDQLPRGKYQCGQRADRMPKDNDAVIDQRLDAGVKHVASGFRSFPALTIA